MMDHITLETSQKQNGFGTRLKIARETLNLSPKDVAARLHLNPRIIHIIEEEDFENAPPAIFLRGYLRSYARLLNIPDAETTVALKELGLNVQTSSALPPRLKENNNVITNEGYIKLVTYLVIGLSVVLVGIWWESHTRSTADSFAPVVAQQTVQPVQIPVDNTPAKPLPPANTNPEVVVMNHTSIQHTPVTPAPQSTPASPASTKGTIIAEKTAPVLPPLLSPTQQAKRKLSHKQHSINPHSLAASVPEPGLDIYE